MPPTSYPRGSIKNVADAHRIRALTSKFPHPFISKANLQVWFNPSIRLVLGNGNESAFSSIRQTTESSFLISSSPAVSDQLDSHNSLLVCGTWTATEPEQRMRQSLGRKSWCERDWQSEEHWDLMSHHPFRNVPIWLQNYRSWCSRKETPGVFSALAWHVNI